VKSGVEGASRDEVVEAMPEAMADMLQVLEDMGVAAPPKDV
jgi:MoxR-like ATPase